MNAPSVQNGGDQPGHHAARHRKHIESTLETRRNLQVIAWSLGDTHATEALIPSVLDTPSPTTPDNRPHHHAGPPKTTAPSRTTPRSPRTSLRVLHAGTDGRRRPCSRSSTETTVQPAVGRVARASALDPPRAKVRPGRRTDLDAEPDRSRREFQPISMRSTTDLDAEYDRSRCGVRPISAKGGGGQSRPAAASATRPPRPGPIRRAARRPPVRRARRR